jgi:hypothetical protein
MKYVYSKGYAVKIVRNVKQHVTSNISMQAAGVFSGGYFTVYFE